MSMSKNDNGLIESNANFIQSFIIKQNEVLIEAYKNFSRTNNDFWKMVEQSKPADINAFSTGDIVDLEDLDYYKAIDNVVISVGQQLQELKRIAANIKAIDQKLDNVYYDNWQFIAMAVSDHPEMSARRKFCEDYRKDQPEDKWKHYYKVGDKIISQRVEGYYAGEVISMKNYETICIKMFPINKRREGKIVCYKADSLEIFPANGNIRRKE